MSDLRSLEVSKAATSSIPTATSQTTARQRSASPLPPLSKPTASRCPPHRRFVGTVRRPARPQLKELAAGHSRTVRLVLC